MLTIKSDAIRARALGVALDAPDEKDAVIKELRRAIDMMWDDCEDWRKAFECMRAAYDKFRRTSWIVMVCQLGVIAGLLYVLFVRL